jgi:TonB family protein
MPNEPKDGCAVVQVKETKENAIPQFWLGQNAEARHTNFWSNLKEVVAHPQKTYHITAQPVANNLLLPEKNPFHEFIADLRIFFLKPISQEAEITAQPLEVGEIFKDYQFRSTSLLLSASVHALILLALLFLPFYFQTLHNKTTRPTTSMTLLAPARLVFNMPAMAHQSHGGGGGGALEKTRASMGRLPRAADRQLAPPTVKVENLQPQMPIEPTVVAPQVALLPMVKLTNLGDPNGALGPLSNGMGKFGGIGNGDGTGVGDGEGPGVGLGKNGGIGGGDNQGVGGGVSKPTVIYRIEPLYSEEARKARFQGVIVLSAVVMKDGTVKVLRILRGLGLGLDENAIAALKQWKFQPASRNGVNVDFPLNVEVNFSLR